MPRPASSFIGAALLLAPGLLWAQDPDAALPPYTTAPPRGMSILKQIDQGFVEVYEKVAPGVVVIEAIKKIEDVDSSDKGFDFFLNDKDQQQEEGKKPGPHPFKLPQQPARSEGSGFFIRSDGYIITNRHVIAEADKLSVRTKDGRNFPARVIGADDTTDIAVIKIDARDLPPLEFGDSDALKVGQLVCAIGTPYNQDFSFTCGWVSGKGRTNLLGPTSQSILYEDYIQTDAFINPGNSGGPLFDVEGKVIGMNTLINGVGRGLAFAIPSNILRQIGNELIMTGRVIRPWLGVRIESLGENPLLREHAMGVDRGVVVDTIEAGAPAIKSDLRPADIITEVDGAKVATAHDLQREVLKKRVGQAVQLTVWRSGQMLTIPVLTGELPTELAKVPTPTPPRKAMEAKDESFGMKLKDSKSGAQIVQVLPDSAASLAELQPDDVITDVESKQVMDSESCLAALRTAAERADRRGVLLNIERHGRRTYAVLNVEK